MPKSKHLLIIHFLLILITLTAYGQVRNHRFVDFDDNIYVTENSHIQDGLTIQGLHWAFTTGYAKNWHPLTWISHMLDVQFFGLNPRLHHLTSLLFHIANVLLLFFILDRMTKAPWRSAFVAALFALHPLHVESVAWVAERKDVLSTFFFLLTLLAYSYYVERPRFQSYLPVVAFFALGLTAKPMLVTLPFVLLLLDYWPLERFGESKSARPIRTETKSPVSTRRKRGKSGGRADRSETGSPVPAHEKRARSARQIPEVAFPARKPANPELRWASIRPLILEKIPLLALATLSCGATYIAQNQGGMVVPIEILPLGTRVANAFVSYILYIVKTIRPIDLAVFYPHPGLPPLWQVLGALLFLVAVTFAVIRTAKRFPHLPVGWLWFAGTLVPVIGIVQVGAQAMADRYTYIPSIGLFLMAAWGIPEILEGQRRGKEILAAFSAFCLLCLFVLTRTQVGYWHDSLTLFDHALDVTENNFYIYSNRGQVYNSLGNYTRGIADLDRAIQINPKFAQAYNNRGNALDSLGNYVQAVEDYDRAIEIDPRYAEAHYNRGVSYQHAGMFRQAIADYDEAVAGSDFYKAEVFGNRGAAYSDLGDQKKAIEDYDRAIEIDPKNPRTYFNRGLACGELGDQRQAIHDYSMVISINPKYPKAYFYRGMTYEYLGMKSQAIEDISKAARLGYEDAKNYLASRGLNW
jgi:tetratricopeptide (TPR) repeat protein